MLHEVCKDRRKSKGLLDSLLSHRFSPFLLILQKRDRGVKTVFRIKKIGSSLPVISEPYCQGDSCGGIVWSEWVMSDARLRGVGASGRDPRTI